MLGTADPRSTFVDNRLSHVRLLGDAYRRPCPLTEYGTLKSLSQILVMNGGKQLPRSVLSRPVSREVDPHMPMELFA